MNLRLKMLVWKEWRERRTMFFICLAWMLGGTVYCIAYALSFEFRAPVASFFSAASLFGLAAPIFAAMRTALGETTEGSRSFSDALPISARARGWMRLAGGAGVLVMPIVAGALLLSVFLATGWLEQAPWRPPSGAHHTPLLERESLGAAAAVGVLWTVTAVVVASATSLYVLLCVLGTMLKAESHAGFVGAAVAAAWFMAQALGVELERAGMPVAEWSGAIVPQSIIVNYGYGHERGHYGDLAVGSLVLVPLLVNFLLQGMLAALFVRRYRRKVPGRAAKTAQRRTLPVRMPWKPPLPTRGIALTWLALRQSVPLCLPGLALACLMTPLQMTDIQSWNPQRFSDYLPSAMWIVGILWAVVVGAGVFAPEVDWRIGEFWRSLPVPAWRLFATKFFFGLAAVLLVLDGTAVAAAWNSPDWGRYYSMNWPYVICIVPLHATMFAIAVAWTCVTRRPVLGAIAAIAAFALVNVGLAWSTATRNFGPIELYNRSYFSDRLNPPDHLWAPEYPLVMTCMALILLACVLIGWRALARYDPRRQSD